MSDLYLSVKKALAEIGLVTKRESYTGESFLFQFVNWEGYLSYGVDVYPEEIIVFIKEGITEIHEIGTDIGRMKELLLKKNEKRC